MDELVREVTAGERRIVVVDVEATCWKKGVFSRKKETIEVGAVKLLESGAVAKTSRNGERLVVEIPRIRLHEVVAVDLV